VRLVFMLKISPKKPSKAFRAFRKYLVRRRPRPKKAKAPREEKAISTRRKKGPGKSGKPLKKKHLHARIPSTEAAAPVLGTPMQMMLRAASFAARKHMGQKRADGVTPYFSHVARVAFILTHLFGVRDERLLAAAFLHDTLEDTATDYDEIESEFGEDVADAVVLLTKNNMLPKRKREREYEQRLRNAPERVQIAKMADLYDNLSDRVTSIKILKTTATAQRLLKAFGPGLRSRAGRAAHAQTSLLLRKINRAQAASAGRLAL
jgi:guanosine-3',5'-bis(diphosphate) 3'-pyrophosphohydrolase